MPRKKPEENEIDRYPFSPAEVGRITRTFLGEVRRLNRQGGQYNGSKAGHQFELRYNPVKKNLWWRVCIDRTWKEGEDIDVFQSLRGIGLKIANKALDRRIEKLAEEVA